MSAPAKIIDNSSAQVANNANDNPSSEQANLNVCFILEPYTDVDFEMAKMKGPFKKTYKPS